MMRALFYTVVCLLGI